MGRALRWASISLSRTIRARASGGSRSNEHEGTPERACVRATRARILPCLTRRTAHGAEPARRPRACGRGRRAAGGEPDVRCSSSRRAHSDSAQSLSSKPTVPCSSRSPRHRTSGSCWLWLAPATAPGGSCHGAGGARAGRATRGARARGARAGRVVAGAAWW